MTSIETQRTADLLVQREVLCCMSAIVAACATGGDLMEQATDLYTPLDDHEGAAIQAGWSEVEVNGEKVWSRPTTDDDGRRGVCVGCTISADGACVHADSAWSACVNDDIEPYQWEVYEHWAVSEWFARRLEEKGERVDLDFGGLAIWGRTTTGQAIHADAVVLQIAADTLA